MKIELKIAVVCHICRQALDEEYDESREKLLVTPCPHCLDKAKDKGIEEGIRECEATH